MSEVLFFDECAALREFVTTPKQPIIKTGRPVSALRLLGPHGADPPYPQVCAERS